MLHILMLGFVWFALACFLGIVIGRAARRRRRW